MPASSSSNGPRTRAHAMTAYRVVVAGRLPEVAARMLADLGARVVDEPGSASTLEVADQAALVGVVNRVHGLGMVIEHVDRAAAPGLVTES